MEVKTTHKTTTTLIPIQDVPKINETMEKTSTPIQTKNDTKDERTLETSFDQLLIQVTTTKTKEDKIFHPKTTLQALPGCLQDPSISTTTKESTTMQPAVDLRKLPSVLPATTSSKDTTTLLKTTQPITTITKLIEITTPVKKKSYKQRVK